MFSRFCFVTNTSCLKYHHEWIHRGTVYNTTWADVSQGCYNASQSYNYKIIETNYKHLKANIQRDSPETFKDSRTYFWQIASAIYVLLIKYLCFMFAQNVAFCIFLCIHAMYCVSCWCILYYVPSQRWGCVKNTHVVKQNMLFEELIWSVLS